jgi:hypothetical protein
MPDREAAETVNPALKPSAFLWAAPSYQDDGDLNHA